MKDHIARPFRKIFSLAATRLANRYLQKDRAYTYKDLNLVVFKDVFHPGLFRSTGFFAEWVKEQDIMGKRILEVGSGSGLISLIAAKKGANVTAVDINSKAVENTRHNAEKNHLIITAIHSDLLREVKQMHFDLVFINPPFYPKQPRGDYEKAWYCGPNFEYFHQLFEQLEEHDLEDKCYLILSDTCDLVEIETIAAKHQVHMAEVKRKKIQGEQLFVYKTTRLRK